MALITLNFNFNVQTSVAVGDTAYYVTVGSSGGFNINANNVVEIGEIVEINRENNTIVVDSMIPAAATPSEQVFILFSKNNCQEFASMLGYYGLFKFRNTSTERAELFSVTVDAFESSK